MSNSNLESFTSLIKLALKLRAKGLYWEMWRVSKKKMCWIGAQIHWRILPNVEDSKIRPIEWSITFMINIRNMHYHYTYISGLSSAIFSRIIFFINFVSFLFFLFLAFFISRRPSLLLVVTSTESLNGLNRVRNNWSL